MEELEAIKEAEEAALAEAEAAAAEAAEAMEGLFGDIDGPDDDDPGGDRTPESPSGSASQTGSQAVVDSQPLVDVVSGSGIMNPSNHGGSLVSVATSQKYVIQEDDRQQRDHHGSFSHSVDGMNNSNVVGDDTDGMSLSSVPYRSEISLNQPHQGHSHHYSHYHHHHRGSGVSGVSGSGINGGGSSRLSSLPASPYVRRASKSNSFSSHVRLHEKYGNSSKKPLILFTYLDAQEHLPYADDSTAVTPKSELNGGIVVDTPTRIAGLSRKMSYNSHSGKVDYSYNSHENLRYPPSISSNTKEGILTKRMAHLISEKQHYQQQQPTTPNSILFDPIVGGPEYPSQYGPNGSASIDKMDLHQQMDMHNHRKCSNGNFINNGKVDSVDLQVSYFVNPYAKVLFKASKIRFETCVYLQQHLHNKNS